MATEKGCLLPWLAQLPVFFFCMDRLPAQGWYHPQWAGQQLSIKKTAQTCLQASLMTVVSIEVLSDD